MFVFRDQLNRTITLDGLPKRIVSLVPSQTELLSDLGLDEEIVGITKFCVHPLHWFRSKAKVGGTKKVNIAAVASLYPDLIIANREENVKEQIEKLESIAPVWISNIANLEDAKQMIISVGEMTGKKEAAISLTNRIQKNFEVLRSHVEKNKFPSTAYLIWKKPYMTIGGDTFIHDMLRLGGFENVFGDSSRYPTTSIEELKSKNTELILLSTEPYPFRQEHIDELAKELPGAKILLVDGEMFSWYGSRLQYAASYIEDLWER
jgi:ABC-type Fe3+-hydroxamate transport system substrate-binding protein